MPDFKKNKDAFIVLQINRRFLPAWLLGIPFSYFILGFLGNFYTTGIEFIPVSIIIHSGVLLFGSYLMSRVQREYRSKPVDVTIYAALALALTVFLALLVNMALRFPNVFDRFIYLIDPGLLVYFFIGIAAAFPVAVWVSNFAEKKDFKNSRFFLFVDKHLDGLLLAAFFFTVYLLIASIFNQPLFNYDDLFFDTDAKLWRTRFATESYRDYFERPVHPLVLMVVRPFVRLISLFLKGDTFYAAVVLVALTGALSVFLVWYFVKETTGSSLYAALVGALFGGSTSQMIFGSFMETYVFLGAAALIFIVLLLKDMPTYTLVLTGIAAFGITISNFAQTVFAHILVKRNLKQWIIYGAIVTVLVFPLNILNNYIYPNASPYFWDFKALGWEEKNVFPVNLQRANYLGRVMVMSSFVAPEPLLLKEYPPILKVWLFRASIRKAPTQIAQYYGWFETSVAYLWLGFVALGGLLFLKNLRKQDMRFPLTFIVTILFYFALHLQYGKDVFLYAANWTYAITLFLALAWQELSKKRWFQFSLLGFVSLMLVNNTRLIFFMLTAAFLHTR